MTDFRSPRRARRARAGSLPRKKARFTSSGLFYPLGLALLALPALLAGAPGAAGAQQATHPERQIVVSLEARQLWLVAGADTVLRAPVAIGRRETFRYRGQRFDWRTPRGERSVRAKRRDPVWTVPEWHYFERAANEGLPLVRMTTGRRYALPDGSWLGVHGRDVVRGRGDRYWKVPQGRELVIGGVLYMPPPGTSQRRVPGALGTRALDLGEGYLIHGTNPHNEDSVGEAASHGCIRMDTADIERLFDLVAEGTLVRIY